MAADAFELVAEALERETYFDRLAARGTVRLALRQAGLDARNVTSGEMRRVVELHLPAELECRGVENVTPFCARLAASLARLDRASDRGPVKSLFADGNLGSPEESEPGEEPA